jgi:chemotaxis response regulator CheB
MGRDGAQGLKRMRANGAFTIAQDEASCAVYGMPAAAMAAEAVDLQLPLDDLPYALSRLAGGRLAGTRPDDVPTIVAPS